MSGPARKAAASARMAVTFAASIRSSVRSRIAMRGFAAKRRACRATKSQ